MTRYMAVVGYDGTAYAGWQRQPGLDTIQGRLEQVLSRLTQQPLAVTGAGRTDAGVHAHGQVFHFDSPKDGIDYRRAFNALLPDDIHVFSCAAAAPDFHARFDACWKRYDYVIGDGPYDPLRRRYVTFVSQPLDVAAIAAASAQLTGTHDYTSFNATPLTERPNQVRTIFDIQAVRHGGEVTFSYWGDAFLRHQVRMMTGALAAVGTGELDVTGLTAMMQACDKQACTYNLPPQGLCLMEIGYRPWTRP